MMFLTLNLLTEGIFALTVRSDLHIEFWLSGSRKRQSNMPSHGLKPLGFVCEIGPDVLGLFSKSIASEVKESPKDPFKGSLLGGVARLTLELSWCVP
jgi:hypothetical protein